MILPAIAVLCSVARAEESEETLQPKDLPAVVLAAVEARWPGATIREAEVEDEGYELEVHPKAGVVLEVEISETGAIGEVEEEEGRDLEPSDFPETVKNAIQKRWPGATIVEMEAKDDAFEVELKTSAGESIDARVTAKGKIRVTEASEDDDD